MEEPLHPVVEPPTEPPVEYVGGLTDAPRPRAWPWVAFGAALVILVGAAVVLWNPIRSLGRSAGATIAPYDLTLTSAIWSSNQKISGVPLSFSLTVHNQDQRVVHGLTLRFSRLDPGWRVLGATGAESAATISGTSIFFAGVIPPGGTETLSVSLVPTRAMDSEIDLTLTPRNGGSTAARVAVPDGRILTTLALGAKVREPTDADADARLTAIYEPQVPMSEVAVWQIHVANTGPIAIKAIRLRFPAIQSSFEFSYLSSQARVLPDGETLEFPTALPPGGQTILLIGVLPRETGRFQIPVQVFLGEASEPMSAANGGPPLSIDLTVS